MLEWRDGVTPVAQISSLYGENGNGANLENQVIVMVGASNGAFGLPVDEVIGQQQVMIKPLRGFLREIRGGIGCALLSSGAVAVALDTDRLINGGQAA